MKEITEKRLSVIVSRCKQCDYIFVVSRKFMGHDDPDLDPRILHLQKCKNDQHITRLDDNFETHVLRPEGELKAFFHKLCLTEKQIKELVTRLSDWLA